MPEIKTWAVEMPHSMPAARKQADEELREGTGNESRLMTAEKSEQPGDRVTGLS
ncbi:hypothetical protein [Methanocella arvoryzae]|uniref:hypothetical protein n=1 Tax=Methanocella arvoryzae TaxID=1175445 RepID=UPI0013053DB8|nr:hypothetical protein [Methanocella arvoryzae]